MKAMLSSSLPGRYTAALKLFIFGFARHFSRSILLARQNSRQRHCFRRYLPEPPPYAAE
jgi:hypothetical protein